MLQKGTFREPKEVFENWYKVKQISEKTDQHKRQKERQTKL